MENDLYVLGVPKRSKRSKKRCRIIERNTNYRKKTKLLLSSVNESNCKTLGHSLIDKYYQAPWLFNKQGPQNVEHCFSKQENCWKSIALCRYESMISKNICGHDVILASVQILPQQMLCSVYPWKQSYLHCTKEKWNRIISHYIIFQSKAPNYSNFWVMWVHTIESNVISAKAKLVIHSAKKI